MKKTKTQYDIRTVAYYLEQGGVYTDILSVLTQLKSTPYYRYLPSPVSILNKACYEVEAVTTLFKTDIGEVQAYIDGLRDTLLMCVMTALAQMDSYTKTMMAPILLAYICEDKEFYPRFQDVIKKYSDAEIAKEKAEDEQYGKDEIKSLEEEVARRDADLDDAWNEISRLQHMLDKIQADSSKADKLLTWNSILDYIESRSNYQYVNQIFRMLTDIAGRATTDEEWAHKEMLEKKMLAETKPAIHNHNQISNSNVIQGTINNPNFPFGTDPEIFIKTAVDKYIEELKNGKE